MKIAFNPFRIISLLFLYISRFFGFFADLFDNISQKIGFKIEPKNKPDIGEKQGKFIIILLLIIKEFSLHTLKLNVTDSIYADIISLLQKYPNSEAYIIQDENESDFILNNKDEAKQRIERAHTER